MYSNLKKNNFIFKEDIKKAKLFDSESRVSIVIQIINIIVFVTYFAIKGFGDIYISQGSSQEGIFAIKHFVLLFGAIFLFIQSSLLNKKLTDSVFFTGIKNITFITIIFACISLIKFNGNFSQGYQTLLALLMIFYPAFYIFCVFQIMSYTQIYSLVKLGFVIYASAYVVATFDKFSVANLLAINFSQSYSPFENSDFSSGLIGFFIYFCAIKAEKKWIIVSTIFNFLVFKRVSIIFIPILLFVGYSFPVDKKVNSNWKYVFALLLFISTLVEYFMMQPDFLYKILNIFPNLDPHYLFMGRNRMFENLLSMNFKSSGLNSTNLAIGRTFEIESLKLFLETGVLGYLIFCFSIWKITGDNLYSTVIMIYFSVKVLSSSSFSSSSAPFMMLLIYLAIATRNNMTMQMHTK